MEQNAENKDVFLTVCAILKTARHNLTIKKK